MATPSPCFSKSCAIRGKGLLDRETKIWSQPDGSNERPRSERSNMGIFMSVTLQAAVHLVNNCSEILPSTKKQPKKSAKQLFQVIERLITDQTEITRLTTIDWQQPVWRETTLLTDRAVQFATVKTYVFSDSVLCLGGISDEPVEAWESRIKWFFGNTLSQRFGSARRGADGFRVKSFPRIHYIGNSRRDSKDDGRNESVNQSNSKEMNNDIDW